MAKREHVAWWIFFVVMVGLIWLLFFVDDAVAAEEGRWVQTGDWNGLLDCESSPTANYPPLSNKPREVRVDQVSPTNDYAAFQFQRSTWDGWARERGRLQLVGRDPRTTTLAQQYRQAVHGRDRYGISQWSCGYRYRDGTGRIFVTGEWKLPARPNACARNLRNRWGASTVVARSICNVSGEPSDGGRR